MSNPNPSTSNAAPITFRCGHSIASDLRPAIAAAMKCSDCLTAEAQARKAAFEAMREPGCRCKQAAPGRLQKLCMQCSARGYGRSGSEIAAQIESYSISSSIPGATPANLRRMGVR